MSIFGGIKIEMMKWFDPGEHFSTVGDEEASLPDGAHLNTKTGISSSVAEVVNILGDTWSILLIRDACMGISRFDDFQRHLGVARNVLSNRIKKLITAGILDRVAYSEKPLRYEYRLTEKGSELWVLIAVLREWGDRWIAPAGKAPFSVSHMNCGGRLKAKVECTTCSTEVKFLSEMDWSFVGESEEEEAFWLSRRGVLEDSQSQDIEVQ
jgi:DNA-binding HxlR family transcriptional regulator